ncbi:MAG: cell division protein FtsQ/DivIB, partial [Candidatus Binatia bacterium]
MKRNRRRGTHPIARAARIAIRTTVALVVLTTAVTAGTVVHRWVSSHRYFEIAAIEVRGSRAASPETIARWAGIERGQNIWSVVPILAEEKLRGFARLRSARVERSFPDRVVIAVEERDPIALVLARSGPLLVDADASLFPPMPGETIEDYPYVTGLPSTAEGLPAPWGVDRLKRALRVLDLWRKGGARPTLSEIRPEEGGDVVAFPETNPMAIRFAADVDADQLDRLTTVLTLWRGREAQIAGVDLTMPGQAVLKLRGGLPKAKRSQG